MASPLRSLLLLALPQIACHPQSKRHTNKTMSRNQSPTRTGAAFSLLPVLCCFLLFTSSLTVTAFMVHPQSMRPPASLSFATTGARTFHFHSIASIARKSHENHHESESAATTATTTTTPFKEDMDTPLMPFPTDDDSLRSMKQSQSKSSSSSAASASSSSSLTRMAQLQRWSEPVQKMLDEGTGGWALSAANLHPATHETINGQVFLATNLGYLVAGLVLTLRGDLWFGLLTDLAAIASFNYHYQQLLGSQLLEDEEGKVKVTMNNINGSNGKAKANNGNNGNAKKNSVRVPTMTNAPAPVQTPEMRLALLIDYIVAAVSILTGAFYLWETGQMDTIPVEAVQMAVLSLGCLAACWVWEAGQPYMIFHSLWHLFSAYAGYLIGSTHQVTQHMR